MALKKDLTNLLWTKICNKIIEEWDARYKEYFGVFHGFDKIERLTNFASAVQQEIEQDLINGKSVDVQVVSIDTLYRAFQSGRLSDKAKDKTLDSLTAYLGYIDWNNFQMEHKSYITATITKESSKIEETTSVSHSAGTNPGEDNPAKTTKKNRRKMGIIGLGCLFILLMLWYYWNKTSKTLVNIIYETNRGEFNAYCMVPEKIDTAYFKYYADPSSENLQLGQVVSDLRYRTENNTHLLHPISGYEILEHRVMFIGINTARVKTKEKWFTQWEGDKDKYDKINEQMYYFAHINGVWKIKSNVYEGRKEPIQ